MLTLLLSATLWGWPLPGVPLVERPFTPPATAYGAGHRGVDLAADAGDPVLAAGAGQVTYAGVLAGRGVVTVTHAGGLRTTYEPVRALVGLGDQVDVGERIGTVATGHAACRFATCLHWGLLRGQAYLDPLALLAPPEVRLLPLGPLPEDGHPGGATRRAAPSGVFAREPEPAGRGSAGAVTVGVAAVGVVAVGAGALRRRSVRR